MPEKLLAKAMWSLGLRYRKHYKKLSGKPDFVFVGARIAVFCDGDFWHGNNWRLRGLDNLEEELARYKPFWVDKIKRNIERDKAVNTRLRDEGWIVMRFWESEIRQSPQNCADAVLAAYKLQTPL